MYNDIVIFKEHPEICAGFTTRDSEAKPRKNEMSEEAAASGRRLACLGLIHSNTVLVLDDLSPHELVSPGRYWVHDCDGGVTNTPGIRLNITSGDCLAIYMVDPVKKAIGLAHAGWRGTLSGIAGQLCTTLVRTYGSDPEDIEAFISPGIGLCCFEVGEDVAETFFDRYPWSEGYAVDAGIGTDKDGKTCRKYKLDLKGINLEILSLCGIKKSAASPLCTCCREDLFYSYRRCGDRDRMLAYLEIL